MGAAPSEMLYWMFRGALSLEPHGKPRVQDVVGSAELGKL